MREYIVAIVGAAVVPMVIYILKVINDKKLEKFVNVREVILQSRPFLTRKVMRYYSLGNGTLLLFPKKHSLREPIALEKVELQFNENLGLAESLRLAEKNKRVFKHHWPRGNNSYSKTVKSIENPSKEFFYNGFSYRLLDLNYTCEKVTMEFSLAKYFDYFDTGEALMFSEGVVEKSKKCSRARKHYGKELDLTKHVFLPGIQTLTIRVDWQNNCANFYMLHRDRDVATGKGVNCLLPAGEFQPATQSNISVNSDLSIWKNIMRESVEEFCNEKSIQNSNQPFLYESLAYKKLIKAREVNKIKVWYLGIGACPLNYKIDILTACVYDADVFDDIFGSINVTTREGTIIKMIPFTREKIIALADINLTYPTSISCLIQAYKYRKLLNIPPCDDDSIDDIEPCVKPLVG